MNRNKRTGPRDKGFTLIEIMVVIAIIGLIATLVVPGVMNRLAEGRVTTTQAKMTNLSQIINTFKMHHGTVPETLHELLQESDKNFGDAYVQNPNLIMDAWENEFVYNKMSSRKFELISLGADKTEGGEFEDADISSIPNKMPGG